MVAETQDTRHGKIIPSRGLRDQCGGISHMTVYRWMEAGILPQPIKISGRNYWYESDIADLIAARRSENAPTP